MANLDQMTQQNAALVEESAAAAAGLRDQAQRLSQVVSVFNVGNHAAMAADAPVVPPVHRSIQSSSTRIGPVHRLGTVAPATPKATTTPRPASTRPRPVVVPQRKLPSASPAVARASTEGDWESF